MNGRGVERGFFLLKKGGGGGMARDRDRDRGSWVSRRVWGSVHGFH
jgi:hypothetical protein